MNIWTKISEAIKNWIIKRSQPKPIPAPVPVPVPTPAPTPDPGPITPSGVRATPPDINQAYMDQNGGSEECSIEPHTGLMIRIAVWCYNDVRRCWGWWLLSSVGEGHIRRIGNDLVFTDYTKNGYQYVCRGFANYEPQYTEATPRLVATGNTCPYDGSRRYVIVDCFKAPNGIITVFGAIVIAVAAVICGALARRISQ